MATTTTLMVMRIFTDWDCRRIRALQALAYREDLRSREVIIAFSRNSKMARMVDSGGSVLTTYAEPGQVYDLETLLDGQEETFGIQIRLSRLHKVTPFRKRRGGVQKLRKAA